jgi:hypothetical protein
MKLDFNYKDLASELSSELDQALIETKTKLANEAYKEGFTHAHKKLGKSGFSLWSKDYKIEPGNDGEFIISITGKLAEAIDRGWNVGEISKMLMDGPRASFNRGEGKNYVDVPISKDADSKGMFNIPGLGKVQVTKFKNAHDVEAQFSQGRSGPPKTMQRIVERAKKENLAKNATKDQQKAVQNLIKSTDPATKTTTHLMIKRVTDKSMWPKTHTKGPEALKIVGKYFEDNFDRILAEVL